MTVIFHTTLLLLISLTLLIPAFSFPLFSDSKTNFTLPATRQKRGSVIRKRTTGSIVATLVNINTYNVLLYTSPVTIGGQTLNLLFDTGSTTTWGFGYSLPPEEKIDHDTYDPGKSSTWKDLDTKFRAKYADDNKASGKIGSDSWRVGNIVVPTQAFGVADSVSKGLTNGPFDGILGLSFGGTFRGTTFSSFVNNVIQLLDAPVFSAYLPYQSDGAFDFGDIRGDRYDGIIFYTPVINNRRGFWKFDSTEYIVGGVTYHSPGVTAIIDTGSEWIFMQSDQVTNYYANVPNSEYSDQYKGYMYPCSQSLPDISLLIGPDNFATVPGANLYTDIKSDDGTMCLGGIQAEDPDIEESTYGLLFMSAFYCIFDVSVPQFGFADIVPPPGSRS